MDFFLLATDILLLLFWVRLWSAPRGDFHFNPFLSAPTRLTDRVLSFLQPVLPLPERLLALLVLVFLLGFRAVAVDRLAGGPPWSVTIGLFFTFMPHAVGLHGALAFSLLDFLLFVARLWSLYLLVQLLTPVPRHDRASQAFAVAARPFSEIPGWLRLFALAAAQVAIMYALTGAGVLVRHVPEGMPAPPALPGPGAPWLISVLYHGWLAALSAADALLAARACLVAFILGSLASLLLQSAALNAICNEGIAVLLGRFGRRAPVGMFDFSPVLYYFGVSILHWLVAIGVLWLMSVVRV